MFFYLFLCLTLQSELGNFARSSTLLRQSFNPKFQTMFQPCNLKGALQLIEDFHAQVQVDWSPRKAVKKSGMYLKGQEEAFYSGSYFMVCTLQMRYGSDCCLE